MSLDFTPLDALSVRYRIEQGEEVSEEELRLCEEVEKRRAEQKLADERYKREQPTRERLRREKESEKIRNKICPMLQGRCLGDECAWFKIVERPARYGEDDGKYYSGMCAVNIPERDSRVFRRDGD